MEDELKALWKHCLPKDRPKHRPYDEDKDTKDLKKKKESWTMSKTSLDSAHMVEKEYLRSFEKVNAYGGFDSNNGNKRFLYDAEK